MKRFLRMLALLGVLVPAAAAPVRAQVIISPPVLVMGTGDRFATMLVVNRTPQPQEITIDFRFGYPATRDNGALYMEYGDTMAEARHSIAPHVRAFPRRFMLQPGARQTVRFTARPPADLEEGGYWTRIFTTSVAAAAAPTAADTAGIQTQIIFRLEQVTTLVYEAGEPTTGVRLAPLAVTADRAAVRVETRLERQGSAPYFGTGWLRILRPDGTLAAEAQRGVSLYFELLEHFEVDRAALPPGSYVAELTYTVDREEIPTAASATAQPVTMRAPFTLD